MDLSKLFSQFNTQDSYAILFIMLIAFLFGRPDFLDLALAYALINLVGVLAVLEFFQNRPHGEQDPGHE